MRDGRSNVNRRARGAVLGITLIELLGCIAVLGVLINLAAGTFVSSVRLSQRATSAVERFSQMEAIQRDFTDTVRASSGILSAFGPHRTGAEQVVLGLPPRDDGAARAVVFGVLGKPGRVAKLVATQGASGYEIGEIITHERFFDCVRFTYEGEPGSPRCLVALELETHHTRPEGRPPTLHRFCATPRGVAPGGRR